MWLKVYAWLCWLQMQSILNSFVEPETLLVSFLYKSVHFFSETLEMHKKLTRNVN